MKVFIRQFSTITSLFIVCLLAAFSVQAESLLAAKNIQVSSVKAEAKLTSNSQIEIHLKAEKGSVVNLVPAKADTWDFSQYHGLKVVLQNTSDERVMPEVKLFSKNSEKWQFTDSSIYLEPGETKELLVYFYITSEVFEANYPLIKKMNAGPNGVMSNWKGIDISSIDKISFAVLNKNNPIPNKGSYLIKDIIPFTNDQLFDYPKQTSFPFVDQYGQYLQGQYPGKLQDAKEWQTREQQELADLKAHPAPKNRSKWGGWLTGPKQAATGYFYTKQLEGKWWFVDPEGYLFWSHGVTGVGHKGANTSIKDRSHYFKDLPSKWGNYSEFYANDSFDFTMANLYRKYGDDWQELSIKRNHQRLKSWGMNTYGNWSQPENNGEDKTPFTVAVHYKSNMLDQKFPDPWHKDFGYNIKQALMDKKRDENADSPWNIGFFVDNELHFYQDWSYAKIITSAKENQPAKLFFVDYLKTKYGDINQLNSTWKTTFNSFNALLANRKELTHENIGEDGKWFYQQMVEQYYRICRDSVKSIFPNHLYLGSRVHGNTNETVLRAAEKYADVISYNLYHRNLKDFTSRLKGLSKPLMATEFHFGALDRGVFHTGLQGVSNQKERAQHYYEYVKSALNNPLFIGTHWFQYRAQAITGRGDGENYQIGLVDITDTPYPETIEAVRKIGYQLYETRMNTYEAKWDFTEISYGPEERQWMNIVVPNTAEPSGILFWAHANGGSPYGMTQEVVNAILDNGYAVVSWGSVGKLQSDEDVETGWADAQVVFDYVRENAATWNMDPDKTIIMGRSRGSIVSWKLAHSGHPAIVGIYMYNALPKGVWPSNIWTDAVTTKSPLTYLVYGPEWGSSDTHAPDNVVPVESAYAALGISHRFTLYEDMWGDFQDSNGDWNNTYWTGYYFPELAAIIETNLSADTTAPVITLTGNSTITINQDEVYIDDGAAAFDDIDGDITANLQVSGSVDSSVPDTYVISYTVSDAAGNEGSATRTVKVNAKQATPNNPPTQDKQTKGSGGSMTILSLLLLITLRNRQIQ